MSGLGFGFGFECLKHCRDTILKEPAAAQRSGADPQQLRTASAAAESCVSPGRVAALPRGSGRSPRASPARLRRPASPGTPASRRPPGPPPAAIRRLGAPALQVSPALDGSLAPLVPTLFSSGPTTQTLRRVCPPLLPPPHHSPPPDTNTSSSCFGSSEVPASG